MDTHGSERAESILILENDQEQIRRLELMLRDDVPGAALTAVRSLAEYSALPKESEFDVVVVDHDLTEGRGIEFIHELKLRDYDPAVLFVAHSADPSILAAYFNSGCERYILKGDKYLDELGPAVRHAIRLRRLEEQNRKLLAKLTETNKLLDEKNRRLDEFSASVAHDLRGPLAGVVMKLQYLIDDTALQQQPKTHELMKRALGSAERLTDILQGMYSYAKLGAQSARMNELDLTRLVEEVAGDLHFSETLNVKIGIGELPIVWGNSHLLRRALMNLINNGVKYNDKPEIIINIGCEAIEQSGLGRFARIFVEDNGRGVSDDDIPNMFSLFWRGASTVADTEGLGFGLSVVQRVVELHYGKISVTSKLGSFTRFTFTLPVEKIDFA